MRKTMRPFMNDCREFKTVRQFISDNKLERFKDNGQGSARISSLKTPREGSNSKIRRVNLKNLKQEVTTKTQRDYIAERRNCSTELGPLKNSNSVANMSIGQYKKRQKVPKIPFSNIQNPPAGKHLEKRLFGSVQSPMQNCKLSAIFQDVEELQGPQNSIPNQKFHPQIIRKIVRDSKKGK